MTLDDSSNAGAPLVKQGHPIRGTLWGILFGLGLAVVLVVTKVIPLDLTQMIIVLIVGIALGVLWSLFGPAKAPKGPAPTVAHRQLEAPDESPEAFQDQPEGSDAADDTETDGDEGNLETDAIGE